MKVTYQYLNELAAQCASDIRRFILRTGVIRPVRVFAIPRGGIPAALAVGQHVDIQLVDDPSVAELFIDDLIDSGATVERWCDQYPGIPFFALIDKREMASQEWIVFPWEHNEQGSFEDNVVRLLQFVGEDPKRGGLQETPARVVKAWKYWCSGYGKDPGEILKAFQDGAESCDQMVIVKDIPFYSHCEHHLAAIFGTVTIAYIPDGVIVGLSKLSRLTDMYARRLQVQERMTNQIADALDKYMRPKGVGVLVNARHMCMESRGVCQQGHSTITSALRGAIRDEQDTRAEFLKLAR